MRKKQIEIIKDLVLEDINIKLNVKSFLSDELKKHELLSKVIENGFVLHGTNQEFMDFESAYIKGSNRMVYGWGFYFTDTPYKIREYGDNLKILDIKPFNLLDLSCDCKWLKRILSEIDDIDVRIHQYKEYLQDVVNLREYEAIQTEIEKLERTKDVYEKHQDIIHLIHKLYNECNDVLFLNQSLRKYINEKMISQFYLTLGFDGFKYENQYIIFNMNKLNKNLVGDVEKFLYRFISGSVINEDVIKKMNESSFSAALYATDDNPISLYLNEFIINEGLIHSYNPYKLIKYICKALGIDESVTDMREFNGNVRISYTIPEKEQLIGKLNKAMNFGGYHFVLKEKYGLIPGWCIIVYEASHLIDIADDVRDNFQVLYHITPAKNLKKILKIGLKPTSKNSKFNYPERTHFLICHPSEAPDFVNDLISTKKGHEWVVLTIDLSRVDRYVQFHYDASCSIGLYTTDNIRPSAIINFESLSI